jgi:eight-cysteine-cluster-containing protein
MAKISRFMPKEWAAHHIFILVTALILIFMAALAVFLALLPEPGLLEQPIGLGNFCGTSTLAACSSDADCVTDGCSDQLCRSKNEERAVSTCEWRECYNSTKYGATCGCTAGKCRWAG